MRAGSLCWLLLAVPMSGAQTFWAPHRLVGTPHHPGRSVAGGPFSGGDEVLKSRALPVLHPGPLAVQLLRAGRWEAALEAAERAFEEHPAEARSHALLGDCAWRAGFFQRAETLYRSGIVKDPGHARNHLGLARVLLARGLDRAAAESCKSAWLLAPRDIDVLLMQSRVLARIGSARQAGQVLDQARRRMQSLPPDPLRALRMRETLRALDMLRSRAVSLDSGFRRGREVLRIEGGLPIVDLRFDSSDGDAIRVPMLVDTGGSVALALDGVLADGIEHEIHGKRAVSGFRDRAPADFGSVAGVEVGEWRFEDVPTLFLAQPDAAASPAATPQAPRPYRGILGPGFALSRVWILNFRREGVAFLEELKRELSEGELVLPFYVVGEGKAVLPVLIGCEPVLALIDTGSQQSRRSRRLAKSEVWGPLQFGSTVIRTSPPPVLGMLDDRVSKSLGVEVGLLLAMDFFRRYGVMTLDYPGRRLILTPRDESR